MRDPIRHCGRTGLPMLVTQAAASLLMLVLSANLASGGALVQSAVGGVAISADGVLAEADTETINLVRNDLLQSIEAAEEELNSPTHLRMISLTGLEAAIREARENGQELPEAVRYLCGIQRIQYVFVYPESNDIVLAGPGEGWQVDDRGNVVGVTTGRPVIQLDDLLIALRSVDAAREVGITCSIEPTDEGRQKLREFLAGQTRFYDGIQQQIEQIMGPQQILINGVPADSHFAHVLVAADYRMKRLAMGLDQSPVPGLSSYLQMVRDPQGDSMPRWWLACNYEAVGRTEDGLGWELRGPGVKAMTENDLIAADGSTETTGQTDSVAQRWADQMTESYQELSQHEAVFGELRNLMDMCVIAAIIRQEGLLDQAGCSLDLLMGTDKGLDYHQWYAPRTVATYCSILRTGRRYVISASGGVDVNSWAVAAESEVSQEAAETRAEAAPPAEGQWWWNASS